MTTLDVAIDSIAAGGDGIARADGMVVFVPRTAPGDRVRVQVDARKRFARGSVESIVSPSALRVQPLCYHYRVDRCGGCQLQHLEYAAQLDAKRNIVRDSISRIGKRPVDAPEITPSQAQWRYRRKLTLAMRRRQGAEWVIGLHPYDDPARVFQLADCPITDERVMAVWRQVMEARRFFPDESELRAFVQIVDNGIAVVMEGGSAWPKQSEFFNAVADATALWWKPANRTRSLVAERSAAGAGAAFQQINEAVGAALHAYVLDRARAHKPRLVIDAYAGSGATAIPLATGGVRVIAIEADRDAADRCGALLAEGSRAVTAKVEDALAEALPADVVLLNPPRTGVHEQVAAILEAAAPAPRAIIYVSCDPATLGRDLARMPRYRIASLRAFDMFPQTAHVETVCELVPESA